MLRLRPSLHDRRWGVLALLIRPLRRHGPHAHRLHRNRLRHVRLRPQEIHGRHSRDDWTQVWTWRREGDKCSENVEKSQSTIYNLLYNISPKTFQTRSILADHVAVCITGSHLRAVGVLLGEGTEVDAEILCVERIGGESARGRVSRVESVGAYF